MPLLFTSTLSSHSLQPGDSFVGYHVQQAPWNISDRPQFPHRGVLLDTARTFMPVPIIKLMIDALMYSKMNVLHLHLTDSQVSARSQLAKLATKQRLRCCGPPSSALTLLFVILFRCHSLSPSS